MEIEDTSTGDGELEDSDDDILFVQVDDGEYI